MVTARPIALDHNFPEPILRAIAEHMPEFAFYWVKDLPPGDLNDLEDHDLIYELHRRGFPVMVTNNYKMLDDRRVLVAIAQTRLTVVALRGAGDDPIFATGVVLRDLRDILKANTRHGMYVLVRPSRVRLERAQARLTDLGADWNEERQLHGLPYAQRNRYPDDHEYSIRC